ncbi:MAG: hypothetical protein QGG40_10980, partial [Myxococcota bacterium]|nr:hypothetical protein [Myxococcota bacterium]
VGSALVFTTPWDDTPRSPAQAAQEVAQRYRAGSVEWKYWMGVAAQYDASLSGTVGDAQASSPAGGSETVVEPAGRPSI